jgi:hypothetical protein
MSVNKFCNKYKLSSHLVAKAIRKKYILEDVHYKNEHTLHTKKVVILKPDEVYDILLSKSRIARNRVNAKI